MSAASFLLLAQVLRNTPVGSAHVDEPHWRSRKLSAVDHVAIDRWYANTTESIRAATSGIGRTAVECKPCGATIEAHETACSYCKTPRNGGGWT